MSPSPIRCRGPWKIHKRSSVPDRWLDEMGFFRKHMARDASCLFRAVSEHIYNTQRYFHRVRLDCVQFMASKRHLFEGSLTCPFENYLKEMSNPSEWGGLVEISALSHLYRRDFVIFDVSKGPQTKISNGYGDTIYLFYSPDTKHYDAVYSKEFIHASSFCQSLVYQILYDGVYQLKDLPYAVDKMLHDKVSTNHFDYFMSENLEHRKKQKERAKIFIEAQNEDEKNKNNNALALKCKHHTEDLEKASLLKESLSIFIFNRSLIQLENVCMNCLNVNSAKDLLDNGITPFPYKVAKALDPEIYRNIEFDVWSELRREIRYGARYCDGTTLQVGVKCLCKLQPDQTIPYHCHIQEMRRDGPCLVFVEELGEKHFVKYDQLEPLPVEQIKPWAPPYRYSRTNSQYLNLSQMLQQIGNIACKQGLNKARKANGDDAKISENIQNKMAPYPEKIDPSQKMPICSQNTYYVYPHMDFVNFQPLPVEIQALPLMVDCRPAGAPPNEITHPPNGAPPENHHSQAGGSGDMGAHGVTTPASVRASTPATTNVVTTYSANYNGTMNPVPVPPPGLGMGVGNVGFGCGPYGCGVKSVVWCGPHTPPPPPPGVNPHVYKSVQLSGSDLPMNDIATLRFYFNLGVECMWAAYGPPPHAPLAHPPPRHYSPRDIAQDMQQLSLQERGANMHDGAHKHKPQDKPPLIQPKGPGQRPLLGPRFKRGNNQDGNQTNNHSQNKGHNNNTPNKGPNNRRNSHTECRPPHAFVPGAGMAMGAVNMGGVTGEECPLEAPIVTFPYIHYPPPIYPVPYYPIDADPSMMGMMGGMSYVGYEEGVEYAPVQHFYPPPYPPPHHPDHK